MSYRNCDSVVKSVIESFVKRSEVGKKKYDTDLDRTDLNISEWLQHAQEEHMDAILYLEKIKNVVNDETLLKGLTQPPRHKYTLSDVAYYNYSYVRLQLSNTVDGILNKSHHVFLAICNAYYSD
jgi:hypothetical protein